VDAANGGRLREPGGNQQATPRPGFIELVAAILFVAWSLRFISRASFLAIDGHRYGGLFDDALISMRYAWNLAHGSGLVWNPGERVEGYSNPLTTLVMAAASAIFDRRNAVLAVQFLGIPTVLATAYVTSRLATRFDRVRPAVAAFARGWGFCAALLFYPLSYWTLGGMETGLLAFLFVAGLLAAEIWAEMGRDRHLILCGAALGLMSVARPDGILLAALVAIAFGHAAYGRDRRTAGRKILALAGVALILPAAQMLLRAAYYGALVPNTYVLKLSNFPLDERLRGGLGFVRPFLPALAIVMAPIALGLARAPSRPKVVAAAALLLLLAYQIAVGGDPWPYWRILTPAIPLAVAVAGHEIWKLAPRTIGTGERRSIRGSIRWASAIAVLAVVVFPLNRQFLREMTFDRRPYQWEANLANVNVALALRQIATPDASVGVYWAGSIPYYTSLRAVDFLGKSDPVIARRSPDLTGAIGWSGMSSVPGHNKYDLDYSIVALRPTYVQGFRWGRRDLSSWGRANYDSVIHRGVGLWLRRGAKEVRWDLIDPTPPRGA